MYSDCGQIPERPFGDDDVGGELAPTQHDAKDRTFNFPLADISMDPTSSAPGPVLMDALVSTLFHLNGEQFAALLPPLVGDLDLLLALRKQTISAEGRVGILSRQDPFWGDDEIRWHLMQAVTSTRARYLVVLDPLLATGWTQVGDLHGVRAWLSLAGAGDSAVLLHGHWTPFLWVRHVSCLEVLCWEHDDVDMNAFNPLHGLLSRTLDLPLFRVACTHQNFGANATIAFVLAHCSHGVMLDNEAPLMQLHAQFQESFHVPLATVQSVCRP